MKHIRNSKAGRKFIIAATAFVALAVPATANATVSLDVQGPNYHETYDYVGNAAYGWTGADYSAPNDWNITDCKSTYANNRVYTAPYNVYTSRNSSNSMHVAWEVPEPMPSQPNLENWILHANVSCNLTKIVTTIKVTHPLVWKTIHKSRSGVNTTSRSHSDSCYFNSLYSGALHLDCWGGAYAQANYHFALPSDARYITRSINTDPACCGYSGRATKSWSGNTAIVRATGWAGIYVNRVLISYQHRVRTTKRTTIYTTLHGVGIGQF